MRAFESYSEFDQELREFRSIDELAAAFPIGEDRFGSGHAILLQLWSPSVMRELTISRLALNPDACDGHTFRHQIGGGALIQLYLGGVHDRTVTSVAKVPGCPVLPEAFELARSGYALKMAAQTPWQYELQEGVKPVRSGRRNS